jgi:hypothetical protein
MYVDACPKLNLLEGENVAIKYKLFFLRVNRDYIHETRIVKKNTDTGGEGTESLSMYEKKKITSSVLSFVFKA